MGWLGEFLRRLRFRLRGARFDQDLAEEMQLHLDLRAEEKRANGVTAVEARAAARRQFGNATQLREAGREAWGWTMLDTLQQDIRYGVRTLAAYPGFTATAVLSLALGIGANTAIFSIINAVLLRSLPIEDPQRLVQIRIGEEGGFTNPIWEQIRDHQQAFSGVLAYSGQHFDLADGGESHLANGMWVSGGFFRVLGVPAMQGRVFSAEDDRRGGPAVAIISYNFWKRNYPNQSNVIGESIRLHRQTFEIVGVTPPWFTGLDKDRNYDVAIPIGNEPLLHTDRSALDNRSWWWLLVLGRLAPRQTLEQAQSRMTAMSPEVFKATLPANWPAPIQEEYLKNSFTVKPAATGFSSTGDRYRTALFTLMAIVGVVLLIACANIANLLLARAAARQREFSMRMAIGASRRRVIRQLMTESLLLSLFGAAGGFLLALWGSRMLVRFLSTTSFPLDIDVSPDVPLLAFTAGAAVLTAVLFGLAPALRATHLGLNQVLKESARGAVRGSTRFHLGKALVAGQVALSFILLAGAGLFLGTLRNLLKVDTGFQRENVLWISANVERAAVPKPLRIRTYAEILDRLLALPGVSSASSALIAPISGRGWNDVTHPEGYTAKSRFDTMVWFNRVSPRYFETMRTPLLAGRDFNPQDDLHSPKVIVIDESSARYFFGSVNNALGKTIGLQQGPSGESGPEIHQVIGVVKDAKYSQINEEPRKAAYVASGQDSDPWPDVYFMVRSAGPVDALLPSIRSVFADVNRDISLRFGSFETQVSESLLQQRIVALLATIFGSLALLLAMVGLYGTTAYTVARRQGEIGIRMALGAQHRSVIWLMLRDVVVLLAVGIALGVAGSLAAGRLIESLLYGVQPNDPLHLGAALAILAAATAMAAYLPARRAARLDPMAALREE
jgi:predicted permease